ncbi:transcription factor ETV6-like [Amphiura filiformis]|uniref:transcription factor ETV6-like n=1 Tax=Amphiura filiformis TaxID=82378 RepID=UPI003B2158D6
MDPTSPFYPLSPGPGAFSIPSASAFPWDFNHVTAGRDIVPMPTRVSPNQGQVAPYPLPILSACSPLPVPTDPLLWTKEDVECWLRWCSDEFSLSNLDPKGFSMNGKALCLLPKDSFRLRATESGDVLYEILQKLIYYNNYLNRQTNNDGPRYHGSNSVIQPTKRVSPNPTTHPSAPPTTIFHPAYHHMYANDVGSRQSFSQDGTGMTGSSHDGKDRKAYVGHGVIPTTTLPLNLKTTESQSRTPCSDSGNSSPGMVEEDHQHQHQHPMAAHPLSRHMKEANIFQSRNGHNKYNSCGQVDSKFRNAPKRHRSVSDLEESDLAERVPKRLNNNSVEDIRLEPSMHHVQYLMQQRIAAMHGGSVKTASAETQQRLPDRDLSQFIFHHQTRQPADLLVRRHNENPLQTRITPQYPVPSPLPFLDAAGRSHGLYFGTDINGGMYHEDDDETVEDEIFASGEKASDCRLLWEFLSQLLKQEKYSPYIKWEDEEKRVFRIQDPTAIANLWEDRKTVLI